MIDTHASSEWRIAVLAVSHSITAHVIADGLVEALQNIDIEWY